MRIRVWAAIGAVVLLAAIIGYLYFLYPVQRDRHNAKEHLRQAYVSLSCLSDPEMRPGQQRQERQIASTPSGSAILMATVTEQRGHWTARVGGYQIEADFDIAPVVGFVQGRIIEARNLVDCAKLLHGELGKSLDAALLDLHNRVLLAFPSRLDRSTNLEECSRKANEAVQEFLRKVDSIFRQADLGRELPTIDNEGGNKPIG